ncbi:aldehyde dehydrogenase family protein [Serratia marcescens]|uniref:aldehyde dehydrogenase family protein n=1 Tax=Serratia marcescens TaxID=615 RepID=UPI003740BD81|nr:aldehyde dehydrogenase family protein [Serratia marcescens]
MNLKNEKEISAHWINGKWIISGKQGKSINPANGMPIGDYFEAGENEANMAIAAAKDAFENSSWKHDRALRARVLNAMAANFGKYEDELIYLLGLENGKVKKHAKFEVKIVPECLRFNAALALTEAGRAASVEANNISILLHEPVGVAGIIAPWNSPAALVIRSLAPALAAGTTVVAMLPRQTAQINHLIAKIISETPELPDGVVNIITGGHVAGAILVESEQVPVISFTGSTETGKNIAAVGAKNLKRLGLELGGKTPVIVCHDADIELLIPKVIAALTVFSGQFCMTGSRLLLQDTIADAVLAALIPRLKALNVSPAANSDSDMGPLIDKSNVERVNALVEDAIKNGAVPLLRGGIVHEVPLSAGAFYLPTVLEVNDNKMPIVQQEIFGPVLTVQRFSSDNEAVALANDNPYGLAASVWSQHIDRPLQIARALQCGTVWINDWATLYDQFEEGGYKMSGLGRMRGIAVIEDFLEAKHIVMTPGRSPQG